MAISTDQARRLVDAQANARDRAERATLERVRRIVGGFRGWWDDGEVDAMARQLVLVVEAGQTQTARLTDAYLNRMIGEALGKPLPPVGVPISPEEWRKADHVEVYSRPAADVRRVVAEGQSLDTATTGAVARIDAMTLMDLALAMTNTSRTVFEARDRYIDGYRRVIHPERSRGGSCGLCAAASDRIYGSGTLMPIHNRCRCETLPIVGDSDPGRSLNDNELQSLYDAAGGSTKGADLKRVRVAVHENGEVGPVLTRSADSFRGPSKVPAPAGSRVVDDTALNQSKALEKQATAAHQAGDYAERDRLRAEARDLRRTAYGAPEAA